MNTKKIVIIILMLVVLGFSIVPSTVNGTPLPNYMNRLVTIGITFLVYLFWPEKKK